jgi:hypothetical protein
MTINPELDKSGLGGAKSTACLMARMSPFCKGGQKKTSRSAYPPADKGRRENDDHADHCLRGHGCASDQRGQEHGQEHGQGVPVGLIWSFTFHHNELFFKVFQFVAHEPHTFAFTTVHKRALPRVDACRSRVEIT